MKMVPQFEVGDNVVINRADYHGMKGVVVIASENGANYVVRLESGKNTSVKTVHCFRSELQLKED